jgi:hypothetical protein
VYCSYVNVTSLIVVDDVVVVDVVVSSIHSHREGTSCMVEACP